MRPDRPGLNLPRATTPSPTPSAGKILSREQLLELRARARAQGKAVVQCHGCFDIVHPGHLRHLRHARAQGDLLLVSITGDSLINKGTGRPLIPQELRAENLAALDCVDWVYIESRPTAETLLEEVRPDVYVKGKEYEVNNDPRFRAERETVERHGGRVFFSSGDVVFSSTALIAALEQSVDPYHPRLRALLENPALEGERLSRLVGRFRGKRVVVVGETILDTYILCDRPDVAGEGPIMTLRPIERRRYDGGAAIIARHLAALGALPTLVTALPEGPEADDVRRRLLADGIAVRALTVRTPIAEKQRFLVGGQKVMKVDLVDRLELSADEQDDLVALAGEAAGEGADAAIVADFGLGLFSATSARRVGAALRPLVGVLAGDVSGRRSHLHAFAGFDLVCPSESELRAALNRHDESLPAVVSELAEERSIRSVIVTMGAEGLVAFDRLPRELVQPGPNATTLKAEHVPALSAHAIDPLGCGDALISVATLALASADEPGGGLLAAGFLGSIAAAVQVQRLGNTVVSATDLRHGLARLNASHLQYAAPDAIEARHGSRGLAAKLAATFSPSQPQRLEMKAS